MDLACKAALNPTHRDRFPFGDSPLLRRNGTAVLLAFRGELVQMNVTVTLFCQATSTETVTRRQFCSSSQTSQSCRSDANKGPAATAYWVVASDLPRGILRAWQI
jgi:hypothetical protein